MAEYDNNMTGIISKNDRKQQPNHPDQTGQCTINGEEYWVNGWFKERKDGTGKFLSLSFRAKDPAGAGATSGGTAEAEDFDF